MPNNTPTHFVERRRSLEPDPVLHQWMMAALMVTLIALLAYSIVMTTLDPVL